MKILTENIPFPDITNDTAVIMAVAYKGQRPPEVPTQSIAGESYRIAWAGARTCWATAASERPAISEIIDLFREGGSSVLFALEHAAHARSYLDNVEKYFSNRRRYTLFLDILRSYKVRGRPFFEVYEDIEEQLGPNSEGPSLLNKFASFFPYHTAFDLEFAIGQRPRDPMSLEEQSRLVERSCGPPARRRETQNIAPFKSTVHLYHAVAKALLEGNRKLVHDQDLHARRIPALPSNVVRQICQEADFILPHPNKQLSFQWVSDSPDGQTVRSEMDPVRSRLAKSPPLTSTALARMASMQIVTLSHDQGYC
jgi:hypothetical protein